MSYIDSIDKSTIRGKKTPRNSRTSPRNIELVNNIAKALEYRKQAKSYRAIAELMGRDHTTIMNWVVRGLDAIVAEPAMQLKKITNERLLALLETTYKQAIDGDLTAVTKSLEVIKEQCKLNGLYPEEREGIAVEMQANGLPNAERSGIRVEFVKPSRRADD